MEPTTTGATTAPQAAMAASTLTTEQKVAKLSEYDFAVIIDKTGSMGEPFKVGSSVSRWTAVQESVTTLARTLCALDDDGIGITFFGGTDAPVTQDNCTLDKLKAVFGTQKPGGGTFLAPAISATLAMMAKSGKKKFIVIATDGDANDRPEVEKVITAQANSQNADEDCTFMFIQVGDDAGATAFLKHLDDELIGKAKFDIVSAYTVAEVDSYASYEDLILDAING